LAAVPIIKRGTALMSNPQDGNMDEGDGVTMNRQEYDDGYDNGNDTPPRRSKRTKFRDFDRDKRSSKRSYRRKTDKDDVWPDAGD
jgi:hypothetical protein